MANKHKVITRIEELKCGQPTGRILSETVDEFYSSYNAEGFLNRKQDEIDAAEKGKKGLTQRTTVTLQRFDKYGGNRGKEKY